MDSSAHNHANESWTDHWDRLDTFLRTDPRDAGCDETMEILDVYAELLAVGSDPAARFPGIRAHLLACGPCEQDLDGLLAAIVGGTSSTSEPS